MNTERLWPFFFEVDVIEWKTHRSRTMMVTIEEDGLMHWVDHHGRFGHQGRGGFFSEDGTVQHFRGDKMLTPDQVDRESQEFTIDVRPSAAEFRAIRDLVLFVGKPWTAGWSAEQSRKLHMMLEAIYWNLVNEFVHEPWEPGQPTPVPSKAAETTGAPEPKTIQELWQNFVTWSEAHNLVLVCRRCGSSFLDAGLPSTRLVCRTCGNSTHFDDERFAALRVNLLAGLNDRQRHELFEALARDFRYVGTSKDLRQRDRLEGDLHHDLLNALNTFLSKFSEVSASLNTDPEARSGFYDAWESAKTRIDLIVTEFKKFPWAIG
jgi:hypothetical protein